MNFILKSETCTIHFKDSLDQAVQYVKRSRLIEPPVYNQQRLTEKPMPILSPDIECDFVIGEASVPVMTSAESEDYSH